MADGYARTSGREGVSLVVPGPGVLNALAGLATAYACSARTLFVCGQIPSNAIGQGLLHEIPDQGAILGSLTKWSARARSPHEIPELLHAAFAELRSGHPRPVALEIPPDVLQGTTDAPLHDRARPASVPLDEAALCEAAALLAQARFPVIQAGGCRRRW